MMQSCCLDWQSINARPGDADVGRLTQPATESVSHGLFSER
jgi:hypothetical protein